MDFGLPPLTPSAVVDDVLLTTICVVRVLVKVQVTAVSVALRVKLLPTKALPLPVQPNAEL